MKGSLTQPVEGADSADNALVHEVVGNKTDTVAGDSLIALAKQNLAAGGANLAVPLADSANNVDTPDVVGNKTDTVAGDSLYALGLVEAAARVVPLADAADNVDVADVVGNKTDTIAGDSLVSQHLLTQEILDGHALTTFPDAAAGAALTAGAANTYGALVSVSGALGANSRLGFLDFDTPAVNVEPVQWELSYAAGVTIVATGMIGFATAAGAYPPIDLSGKCGIIPTGSTLQVRIRSVTGTTTCLAHLSTMPV